MFTIIFQVTVTTTATTPAVTVVHSGTLLITMMVLLAPTSLGKKTTSQHDVVLPLQLIPRDTVSSSVGLPTMP